MGSSSADNGTSDGANTAAEQPTAASTNPGYVHLPMSVTASYVAQLVAEVVQVRHHKGRPLREWVLPSGARNEALDCAVYALAARESFGKHGLGKRYTAPANRHGTEDQPTGEPASEMQAEAVIPAMPADNQPGPQPTPPPPRLKPVMTQRWAAYR